MSTNQVTPQPTPQATQQPPQALVPVAPAAVVPQPPVALPPQGNGAMPPRRRSSPWGSLLAVGAIAALAYVVVSRSSDSPTETGRQSIRLTALSVIEKAWAYVGLHDWRRGELDRITEARLDQHEFVRRVRGAQERLSRLAAERTRWAQVKASSEATFAAIESCPELFREGSMIRSSVSTETDALSIEDARFALETILAPVESAVRDNGDYVPGESLQARLSELDQSFQRAIESYQSSRVQLKAFVERARAATPCDAGR